MTDDIPGVLVLPASGALLSGPQDALDVLGDAWGGDASTIAVPVERLDPAFFDLRSGVAGEIAQKLVNYRIRLVVLGDVSAHEAASRAFRDWVRESNAGDHVWFVPDAAALRERMAHRG